MMDFIAKIISRLKFSQKSFILDVKLGMLNISTGFFLVISSTQNLKHMDALRNERWKNWSKYILQKRFQSSMFSLNKTELQYSWLEKFYISK